MIYKPEYQEPPPPPASYDAWALLVAKAENVIGAYAERWMRVNCTPDEESTLRDLNDFLNWVYPDRSPLTSHHP